MTTLAAHSTREPEDMAKNEDEGGRKGLLFMLLVALGSGAAFVLKKKRDQELDEALWEEPRAL